MSEVATGSDYTFLGFGSPKPDLVVVVLKNGVEIGRTGPDKNTTECYFRLTKIWLAETDTLEIICSYGDYNASLVTMGLNSDDYICSFVVLVSEITDDNSYKAKFKESANEISIYLDPYQNTLVSIKSVTPYEEIKRSQLKPIKAGMNWNIESFDSTKSSSQKPIKRLVTWTDSFEIFVYEGTNLTFRIASADGTPWTQFTLPVSFATLKGISRYGEFEVEMKVN